ncbi:MAG: glycosyltransferase family 2 protein [Planctomycetota bacterium]
MEAAGRATTPMELSLVVPLLDEKENLGPLLDACLPALEEITERFEIILVDDGSTDGTAALLAEAVSRDPRLRAIALRRHFGKGAALAAGIARAQGRRIATIDADLQEDPAEIGRLLAALDEDLDLVTGWRRHRRDSWTRRASSRLFNALVRLLGGGGLRDINCGFKAMRREVARELLLLGGRFRFVPLVARWWGFQVGEREVTHRPRRRGRSSFGPERFPGALVDLIALRALFRYHWRPGHIFLESGVVSGLLGAGICVFLTWHRFTRGDIGHRYPLLALGVLLIAIGVQLVATGVLGEWLALQSRERDPGYRVRREIGFERRGDEG